MLNKKQIIIIAGIGLIFFALSFTVGLFTRKAQHENGKDTKIPQVVESFDAPPDKAISPGSETENVPANSFTAKKAELSRSLTEKQLKNLIYELHAKKSEFSIKEKKLAEKEERILMANEEMQKNVKEMEELRNTLVAQLSALKQQQKVLEEKLIEVGAIEKKNLAKTASIYDKMKTSEAGESMIHLTNSNQMDYAVKITYYMTDRTSANLLAEITKKNPTLAAKMIERLKWIDEVKD